MSITCSVFIATSLDGFIARSNGDIDWLADPRGADSGEDYGYQEFIDSVDTLVVGRNTYELVLTFEAWPYAGKRVVVLSHDFSRTLGNSALTSAMGKTTACSACHVVIKTAQTTWIPPSVNPS